ncbi:hypothetical protein LOAG_01697 [Loa loa]|uniref:Uncharacterized protein n=1 Tax=Loa loa TaxID=7209 RepID=A0A1S0UAB5_LOALO|nr:hypothetical protein LOAG_01697 [Loa loa]EFO26795.1 hypothetical protein LOAG_01697 [Loa loa]
MPGIGHLERSGSCYRTMKKDLRYWWSHWVQKILKNRQNQFSRGRSESHRPSAKPEVFSPACLEIQPPHIFRKDSERSCECPKHGGSSRKNNDIGNS